MKAADVYQATTDAIIAQLESGTTSQWVAPWHGSHGMPTNAATGKVYRGANVLGFWSASMEHGYGSHWATYRQWAGLGRQVAKGSRATFGVKWVDKGKKDDGRQPGESSLRDLERGRAFPVGFAVFNFDQTEVAEGFDGVPWEPPTKRKGPDPIPECAAFFERVGARIGRGEPSYSPSRDAILLLPPIEAFDDALAFYATSAHEHCHWSGHSSRLARDLTGRFGSDSYAMEELIAELGAAFVSALLGIETQPRSDHAAYLASWLRVLRSDSRALYTAATAAQAAADYLTEQAARTSVCAA